MRTRHLDSAPGDLNTVDVRQVLDLDTPTKAALRSAAVAPAADGGTEYGSYAGVGNQLYRVEIHRGGAAVVKGGTPTPANATFKWSRDNAVVTFPIAKKATEQPAGQLALVLTHAGRDERFGLRPGDGVEYPDDVVTLGPPAADAPLYRVADIDPFEPTQVTLDPPDDTPVPAAPSDWRP